MAVRFLADENFPGPALWLLQDAGFDVAWIKTDSPNIRDEHVLERAQLEDRVLLTQDKDFGEMAFRLMLKAESGIILFRLPTHDADEFARVVLETIRTREDWPGHFAVVDRNRVRMTWLS